MRILVVDDHEVVRQGLRALLEAVPGWQVCGEAATGREAVSQAKNLKPNVVVLDITMPELNGVEAARQILKVCPRAEVLILTMHESEEVAREVLEAGARGYVLKSDAGRELVAAVTALGQGKPYLTPRVSQMVLDGYLHGVDGAPPRAASRSRLTPREREVLQLLAEGKSNKEVGVALRISAKTVEAHRGNIMRKLALHSVADLVHYAIRNKLIEA